MRRLRLNRVLPMMMLLSLLLTLLPVGHVRAAVRTQPNSVAAGDGFSLAIRDDGTVWGWGQSTSGQLGPGAGYQVNYPVQIEGLDDVVAIAGHWFALALKSDGTVWSWGREGYTWAVTQVPGLQSITAIAAGQTHYLALKSDGTVWAWGSQAYGALGDGIDTGERKVPAQVAGLPRVVAIAAGPRFSVAVTEAGQVYTWGTNYRGELGIGPGFQYTTPQLVAGIDSVAAVSAFGSHVLALRRDGTVWGWGHNGAQQLGDGTRTQRDRPVPVAGIADATKVVTGEHYSAALKADGTVWLWGSFLDKDIPSPAPVAALPPVVDLAGGRWHLLAPTRDGTLWAYGPGSGALGVGDEQPRNTPVQVLPLTVDNDPPTWTEGRITFDQLFDTSLRLSWSGASDPSGVPFYRLYINGNRDERLYPAWMLPLRYGTAADTDYTFRVEAIDPQGHESTDGPTVTVHTPPDRTPPRWRSTHLGAYTVGQTGATLSWSPAYDEHLVRGYHVYANGQQIAELPYLNSSEMRYHITGLTPDTNYRLQVQGYDQAGNESGDGPAATITTLPIRNTAIAVALGAAHGVAAALDGSVWAWGDNASGQSAPWSRGGTVSRPQVVAGTNDIVAVAAGAQHSVALRGDGRVWSWGSNEKGLLGRDTGWSDSAVGIVPDLGGVTAIAAGAAHTLALKADGTVWAWGSNDFGQLGDGSTSGQTRPVLVRNLTGVRAIAAGETFSVALLEDGSMRYWGALQPAVSGAPSNRLPTAVPTLNGLVAITAGGHHVLAVTANGTVRAWGDNSRGQLGDGTTTHRWTPVQLPGLQGIAAVGSGAMHSLAVTNDGLLWAWGDNNSGQIGDGTVGGTRTAPVSVSLPTAMSLATGGGSTSLAVGAGNGVLAWGAGDRMQLGDSGAHGAASAVPVQVQLPWVQVDNSAPSWPAGSTLIASEVGQTGLRLTWTAAADNLAVTAYRIYQNGKLAATVDGKATTQAVTGLLADTAYQFKVAAGDAAGNWTTGPAASVRTPDVDRTAPALATGPDGKPSLQVALRRGEQTVLVPVKTATAQSITFEIGQADRYALVGTMTEPIGRIDLNGKPTDAAIDGDRFTLAFTPTGGSLTMKLDAYDLAGNKGVLPTVRVDVPPGPSVSITSPAAKTALVGRSGLFQVSGSTTGRVGSIKFYSADQPGQAFGAQVTMNGGNKFTAQVTLPTAADGVYRTRAVAFDPDGVASLPSSSGADVRTVTVDVMAPAAPRVTSPQPVDGLIGAKAATVTITGSAEPLSTLATAPGGTLTVKPVNVDKAGLFSVSRTVPEGTSCFALIATDAAGNASPGTPVCVLRDTAAPILRGLTAVFETAAGHREISSGTAAVLAPKAPEYELIAAFSEDITSATLGGKADGVTLRGKRLAVITVTGLKAGKNAYALAVSDAVGNVARVNLTVSVDATTPVITVTSPRTALLGSPAPGAAAVPVTLTGTAGEPLREIRIVAAPDGSPADLPLTVRIDARDQRKWTATLQMPLTSGTWSLRVVGTDMAGNMSRPGTTDTVTVIADPVPPELTVDLTPSRIDGEELYLFTGGSKLTVKGRVSDRHSGVAGAVVAGKKQTVSGAPAAWDFTTVISLKEGALTPVTVTGLDVAGNASATYRIYALMKSSISRLKASGTWSRTAGLTVTDSTDAAVKLPTGLAGVVPVEVVITSRTLGEQYRHMLTADGVEYNPATGVFSLKVATGGWAPGEYTVTVTAKPPVEFPGLVPKTQVFTFTVSK